MSLRGLLPGLALAVLGCSRTPPEPDPATTSTPPSASHAVPRAAAPAATPPDRCIAKLPAEAPAIPRPASATACPVDPEPDLKLPTAEVAFPDAPGRPRVVVELALTEPHVQRGLMYRRALPESAGMLFRLPERREHTFWMRNTCIPLDMLFVDDDGTIVGIVESAEPLTDATRSVGCPSTYVLEVNAGYVRKHGVTPGQKLGLPAAVR